MSKAKTTPVSVPVGYRFHPTDEELVYYLKQKMQGNDSEINGTIPEMDVCNYEPTELYALLGTETEAHGAERFFSTKKHYKYHNSDRSNRCTKEGYWKITAKEREIKDQLSKAVIGKKKTLTFYQGRAPNSKKTSWVIHEYSLPEKGDFVICRLKYKSDNKGSSIYDEGQPSSSHVMFNCDNQAADVVIQENGVSTRDEDETMYQMYDVYPELCVPPEQNLDSLFRPFQPQDYSSSIPQSPRYTNLENVPQANAYYGYDIVLH